MNRAKLPGVTAKLGVVSLALMIIIASGLATRADVPLTPLAASTGKATVSAFPPTFVDQGAWLQILSTVEGELPVPGGNYSPGYPYGGVVPHHLLAAPMIAAFFLEMGRAQPERVLVLGPNHWGKGAPLITADRPWDTPAGLAPVDKDALRLLALAGVVVDNEVMGEEHAIGNLMPFIAHYLPGARVVPLVLRGGLSLERLRGLTTSLEPLLVEGTVVIASVDFSHYLTPAAARLKDRETMTAIERRDLAALLAMGNDHLDSPPALVALLLLMEQLGRREFAITGHANSGDLLQSETLQSTSYFTLLF